jgi:predicted MPP superfamily phosphohydrolase
VALLRAGFAAVREAKPDVLLLGGDYVFLDAEPPRLALLEQLAASVGCPTKLAVLGNHDLWAHDHAISEALARAGVRVLVNEATSLPEPWSDVVVIGLDDPWTGACDPAGAAAQLDGQPFRIVLCHSPDGLGRLAGLRFDVFMAGHTHGGHVAAPWGPIVLPHGTLCRRFAAGPATLNGGWICVSRGLGGVEVPVRTFAPPDIVLLDLSRRARPE